MESRNHENGAKPKSHTSRKTLKNRQMKTKQVLVLSLIIGTLLGGCVSRRATLKTFIDPAIQSTSVKTTAVFAMRNTAFSPGETMEMDRTITQAFFQTNVYIKVIGTTDAGALLNRENLADEYSSFLSGFEYSGMPNTVFLNKLKERLNVDAILQGRLSEVVQTDRMKHVPARTTATVRYTLLSTTTGRILWEATSNAVIQTHKRFAPPIYEVATFAQNKILTSIPTLGK
jgi:hypothetical protein